MPTRDEFIELLSSKHPAWKFSKDINSPGLILENATGNKYALDHAVLFDYEKEILAGDEAALFEHLTPL